MLGFDLGTVLRSDGSVRSAFGLTLVVVSLHGCEASLEVDPVVVQTRTSTQPKPEAEPSPRTKAKVSGDVSVKVLHHDAWTGSVTLLGIDPEQRQAVVRLESHDPPTLSFETIDLAGKGRVRSWSTTGERAREAIGHPFFSQLGDDFAEDAGRFATLLHKLGPWHSRGALASPTFAVGPRPERFLFGAAATDGSKGDWLFGAAFPGASRRLDAGLKASYRPVFDVTGETVAFVGCQTSPCDYGLFLTSFGEGKPRRVAGIQGSSNPQWHNGSVLTLGTKGKARCLFRAPKGAGMATALECLEGVEEAAFTQDAEGRTAVLSGTRGRAGEQRVDVVWVLLEDGSVLAEHTVEKAVGSSVLSDSGLLALPMQRGSLSVVDLVTGVSAQLGEHDGWFFGFDGARWVGDSLILLRKLSDQPGFDVVSVDARTLAQRNKPWL